MKAQTSTPLRPAKSGASRGLPQPPNEYLKLAKISPFLQHGQVSVAD